MREEADRLLPQLRGTRVIPVSGLTGAHVDKLLEAVVATHEIWNMRISTGRLNRWLAPVIDATPPPAVSGRRIKIRYMTQPKARPPFFVLFGNSVETHPGELQALSRQRPARDFRPVRRADPALDALGRRESLRAEEATLTASARRTKSAGYPRPRHKLRQLRIPCMPPVSPSPCLPAPNRRAFARRAIS